MDQQIPMSYFNPVQHDLYAEVTDISEGKNKLLEAIEEVSSIVGSTLGYRGKNVMFYRRNSIHDKLLVTNDGVTVNKKLVFKDEWKQLANELLGAAALKTVEQAGDGTTTTQLLIAALLREFMGVIEKYPDINVFDLKAIGDKMCKDTVDLIENEYSIDLNDDRSSLLKSIATVSANNDKDLGELIGELMHAVGKNSHISVLDSTTGEDYICVENGYALPYGPISIEFLNGKKDVSFPKANIIFVNQEISKLVDILPFIKWYKAQCEDEFIPLLFVCKDMNGDALSTVIQNFNRSPIVPIMMPYGGIQSHEIYEDMKFVSGAEVYFDDTKGRPWHNWKNTVEKYKILGTVKDVVVGEKRTLIKGDVESYDVELRVKDIDDLIKEANDPRRIAFYEERITSLANGHGKIYIHSDSTVEAENKALVVDDAIRACQSAMEDGVCLGAGTTFYFASRYLDNTSYEAKSWIKALSSIFELLTKGKDMSGLEKGKGLNVRTGKIEDLKESGILDPVKVVTCALKNAWSVVAQIITTDHIIHFK